VSSGSHIKTIVVLRFFIKVQEERIKVQEELVNVALLLVLLKRFLRAPLKF